ncbi:hypothetical protein Plo01_47750 [Planobispora longispora]|uniref:Type II methyltransferase M.Eco57I C-terminal domain-containing protein n=2 Tax=Planobispora longispora TaxID=28887 RepID=A0A8J3W809_9ACTN|nr:hypothetical protein GCM10020093_064160 [Planobispora longispora]GIH78346.1 hypothetical protein Plo01_47750 [Planobispora longispora]
MVIFIGPEVPKDVSLKYFEVYEKADGTFESSRSLTIDRTEKCPSTFSIECMEPVKAQHRRKSEESISLGQLAVVRRGVATGDNSFFLRTDTQVTQLPASSYVPAIPNLRSIDGVDLNQAAHEALGVLGVRRWLLRLDQTDIDHPLISRLLQEAAQLGTPDRYLCQARTPWYAIERPTIPDILISPMSKGRFRVARNSVQATPTNSLYGITLRGRDNLDEITSELVNWLVSEAGQASLRAGARKQSDGLFKLEPHALATIKIPQRIARLIAHTKPQGILEH